MNRIIKANRIKLPDLPAGQKYVYDPQHPGDKSKALSKGRVYHIFPALHPDHVEEFLEDQNRAKWSHISSYETGANKTKNRIYRIASQHPADVFELSSGHLIPAQVYTPGEIRILEIGSWIMQVQARVLEKYAVDHDRSCANPDRFMMLQALMAGRDDAMYALHNDNGALIYRNWVESGNTAIDTELRKHLPRMIEVQVLMLVLFLLIIQLMQLLMLYHQQL